MKSKMVKIACIALSALVLYLYPLVKLMFTDAEVTKAIFWDEYYVEISSDKNEFEVFNKYMESKGWSENLNKRFGGLHIFERNNEIKEIINAQIKTVIIDGKLNI